MATTSLLCSSSLGGMSVPFLSRCASLSCFCLNWTVSTCAPPLAVLSLINFVPDHFHFLFKFIYFIWRLITILYWFCHISTWIRNMFLILNPPPTSLPVASLWVIPVHQPQVSCILHRTWREILHERRSQPLWQTSLLPPFRKSPQPPHPSAAITLISPYLPHQGKTLHQQKDWLTKSSDDGQQYLAVK